MTTPEEEEDDYLSMTFSDSTTTTPKETSLQRTARLKKEAAERSRIPNKTELAERAIALRETALATQLDASNKGAKIMAKMGFKGGSLGKTEGARTQPIEVLVKDDRGGVGMEGEKKRKIIEAADAAGEGAKRRRLDVGEYRKRTRTEVEGRRVERLWWGAMRVLEGFDREGKEHSGDLKNGEDGKVADKAKGGKPLGPINLLYRPLIRQRLEEDRERRQRHDLLQSLDRDWDDTNEDTADKLLYGPEAGNQPDDEDDVDPELGAYEALPPHERLANVADYLRSRYRYCFWCKYRYPDERMEGCPGTGEDEHG